MKKPHGNYNPNKKNKFGNVKSSAELRAEHPLHRAKHGGTWKRVHDWPIDWSLLGTYGGNKMMARGAPPGHPSRCQAARRRIRPFVQCGRWAWTSRGSIYCGDHGGAKKLVRTDIAEKKSMAWYSKRAGTEVTKALADMAKGGPDERHSIAEEIDLARLAATDAVKLFGAIVLTPHPKADEGQDYSSELKAKAADMMLQKLERVSELVLKSSKIRVMHEGTVNAEGIAYIAAQVSTIMRNRLDGIVAPSVMEAIIDDIKAIKLPEKRSLDKVTEGASAIVDAVKEIQRQKMATDEPR